MFSISIIIFLIMDPFGNMMVINSLLENFDNKEKRRIILREGLVALLILILSVFFGNKFLELLGLKEYSMRLSGGIILFLIALGMLFPAKKITDVSEVESPLIVPIAMPIIAGPSAISMVILFSNQHELQSILGAVFIASIATISILLLTPFLCKVLGKRGSIAVERFMGMMLIMLSVQIILDGFNAYLIAKSL
jgi:multiple antibiotic resistance protein